MKFPRVISSWLVLVLLLVAVGSGWALGTNFNWQDNSPVIKGASPDAVVGGGSLKNADQPLPDYLKKDVDFGLFWDVWNLVKNKYYQKDVPDTQLFYGALAGVVASLGDPHSSFFTPKDTEEFQKELAGSFEGIGAEIGIKNNRLTIVAPLLDTPAEKAGLKTNDVILAIDKIDTFGMPLEKAVSMIRGKQGTDVILTINRTGFDQPKEIKVTREAISVKSVSLEFKDNNIALIKMRQFNDDTMPLLSDAINSIKDKKGVKGIILDLRGNPGGYLDSAISVASEWVDAKLVVSEKMRNGETINHEAVGIPNLQGYKTVVLVDRGSASASEIVSGALKDWKLATIVGTRTFGKGSVQDLIPLKDGSSVKITIAKWFTPSGISIDDEGIKPDIEIDLTEADYGASRDPQMAKAIEIIKH